MSNNLRKIVTAVVFSGGIVWTGSTGYSQALDTSEPCGLVSRAQIERALGIEVGEGRAGIRTGTVMSCSFPVRDGGKVSVVFRRNMSESWITEQQQRMAAASQSGRFRPVANSQGRAFVLDMASAGAAICIFGRDYYLQVSIFGAGATSAILPKAEIVTRTAMDRLEQRPR